MGEKIPTIYQCDCENRENDTVVADMDGALLIGRNPFPYFALIAFDVGGILRLLLLLLAAPMAALMHQFVSEDAGIKVLIFATFSGVKVSAIKSAAAAVLPKHYSDDLHPQTWCVFSSCGRKCVVTSNPRIMVEPFLKSYLGVDLVLGTEIASFKGFATGLVAAGADTVAALRKANFQNDDETVINVGIIGDTKTNLPFMRLCKERYVVRRRPGIRPVRPETLPKPVIFHDGRLVQKPTQLVALLIILWFPIGIILSILRVLIGSIIPISKTRYITDLLGFQIIPKGTPPHGGATHSSGGKGVLFVGSHRSVLDGVIVSACLGRMTTGVSYSIAGLTEFLSPIKVARLTRDRAKDARLIEQILNDGKSIVMFPEGTTCREPYLLRFSSLFAELADEIVPVAIVVKTSLFHGTTARGHKWLDIFFFCMNPFPVYEITFLNKLSHDQTCGAGKSSYDVANNVQKIIADALGYRCTNLRRKDKYRVLAGTDGLVEEKSAAATST